jgi:hypothetical protein
MAVMTMPLDAAWEITYDSEGRELFIAGISGERFSVNELLSFTKGTNAGQRLEGLIVDIFPNTEKEERTDRGAN